MFKIEIINKSQKKELVSSDKVLLEKFYDDRDCVVNYAGTSDGIYYVKNFPKDIFVELDDLNSQNNNIKTMYGISDREMFPYNVVIKKKEKNYIYVVQPLDTIASICDKIDMTEEELINLNSLRTKTLFIGQRLRIDN